MTPPLEITTADWEGYLDEVLPDVRMRAIEQALRSHPSLANELLRIMQQRDAGCHSLAGIWRAARLTCATRSEWGQYLLGVLEPKQAGYLKFHLEAIGCRYCQANVDDLLAQQAAQLKQQHVIEQRRKKYYASSAGLLRAK